MRSAILTIDDSPTSGTRSLIAELDKRGISAVFFCIGKSIVHDLESTQEILRAGHEIGNHSYSHPHFSSISLDECIHEIEQTETLIDGIYDSFGANRLRKYFRFPYGDKGGRNKDPIQDYLKSKDFSHYLNERIDYQWFHENGLNKDRDVFWTFDCEDYKLYPPESSFTINNVLQHISDESPPNGGSLVSGSGDEIILIHDHPESMKRFPDGYKVILDKIAEHQIRFKNIRF